MSRFANLGALLGQGFTSAVMPRLQMQQQIRNLKSLAPQAQTAADSLKDLNPTALSLLGIQQPKPNPLDFLSQALAASLGGGGLGGVPQPQGAPQAQQVPPSQIQGNQKIITDPNVFSDVDSDYVKVVNSKTGEERQWDSSRLGELPADWTQVK